MSVLVFYVSGHGFGHASRDIEVVNAFGAISPATSIVIRTGAPKWLFDLTVTVPHTFVPGETDTGIVQHDSLTHDIPETMRRAAAFYGSFEPRVTREAEWLRQAGATIVVGDIPPLAFAAANAAGIPSFALGNFTWDWIYEDYVSIGSSGDRVSEGSSRLSSGDRGIGRSDRGIGRSDRGIGRSDRGIGRSDRGIGRSDRVIVDTISGAYSQAREAWRLPMHGGFGSFARVVDVPFVARHSRREPEETRRAFGLPLDRRIVLSSFGGYGLGGLPLDRVDCLGEYVVVVTETTAPEAKERERDGGSSPHVFTLKEDVIYGTGYRYEDLVRAADAVITKPGFGIIAECLANDTAVVYTSRGQFREYPVLVAEMPKFLRCAFIEQGDLFAGRWRASIDRALAQPAPAEEPGTDGAEQVAHLIAAALPVEPDRGRSR